MLIGNSIIRFDSEESLMLSGCTVGALLNPGIGSSSFVPIEAVEQATSTENERTRRALIAKTTDE